MRRSYASCVPLLCLAAGGPALAQGQGPGLTAPPQYEQTNAALFSAAIVEQAFEDAERLRQAGDCEGLRRAATEVGGRNKSILEWMSDGRSQVADEVYLGWRLRLDDLLAAPCPPAGAAPGQTAVPDPEPVEDIFGDGVSIEDGALGVQGLLPPEPRPDPAPAAAGTPPIDRSPLAGLRANFRRSQTGCDDPAAFEAAKAALLDFLDRLIAAETSDEALDQLIAERDDVRAAVCIALPRLNYMLVPFAGPGEAEIGATGIGFVRAGPGEPEVAAGPTGDELKLTAVGLTAITEDFSFGLSYGFGDSLTEFDIAPVAGGAAGSVYGALSPLDSAGISGPIPVLGDSDYSIRTAGAAFAYRLGTWDPVRDIRFRASASRAVRAPNLIDLFSPSGGIEAFVELERALQEYDSRLEGRGTLGGFDFHYQQAREQRVRQTDLAAGLKVSASVWVDDVFRIWGGAQGGAYLYDMDFRSLETNINNFSAPEDRSFTIRRETDDSGVGLLGRLSAGFDVPLGERAFIGVTGTWSWRSEVGAIFNPVTGDQVSIDGLETGLDRIEASVWTVGARVGLGF